MNANRLLPEGFEALERFLAYWDAPDTQTRRERREQASMEQIRDFYEHVLTLAPQATTYLEPLNLNQLPPDAARLMRLLLALAHVSMAIELHRQPRAPYTPYPHGVRLAQGLALFG